MTKLTKDHPKNFQQLTFEEIVGFFIRDSRFESELALAVADLLVEHGKMLNEESLKRSQKSMEQALILYKRSL